MITLIPRPLQAVTSPPAALASPILNGRFFAAAITLFIFSFPSSVLQSKSPKITVMSSYRGQPLFSGGMYELLGNGAAEHEEVEEEVEAPVQM